MTCLLLRLAAPWQSWGTSSRFTRRLTDRAPSKSGILGLVAAARGQRRADPLEDLLELRIAARVEQPGTLERDFHTARTRDGSQSMPLSHRYYLADAAFLVAVHGPDPVVTGVHDALRRPASPLFLGRRSCPPAGPLVYGIRDRAAEDALEQEPWTASPWVQRRHRAEPTVELEIVTDCAAGTAGSELVRDEPVSFDPRKRAFNWRTVRHYRVRADNPAYRPDEGSVVVDSHDPMGAF